MSLKYLTFDCYGTLIDWKKGIEENFAKCFLDGTKLAIEGNEIFQKYVKLEAARESRQYESYRNILAETSLLLAGELVLETRERSAVSFSKSIEYWPAFPDSRLTLEEFKDMGIRCYILSNVDTEILQHTIQNNGLDVDGYVTAEQIKSYKPASRHWLEFLQREGADKNEMVHVANSVFHDIIPARDLGITTIWVNRYGEGRAEKAGDYTVDNLSEIPSLLREEGLV